MKTNKNSRGGGMRANQIGIASKRFSVAAMRKPSIAVLVVCMLVASQPATAAEWRHAHGDSANTGFARVDTLPARTPRVIPTGPIAPGANPVIGPDGTVYLGNMDGEMHAFYYDGTPYWWRQLNPEHGGIYSAPVVGADGSVYVISTLHHADSPDHINQSFLHKFTAGSGWVFAQPFPQSRLFPFTDGGVTNGHPNIWRWNGTEVIIVTVKYQGQGREDISLLAFSPTGGALLANQQVSIEVYEITGGSPIPTAFFFACSALLVPTAGVGCLVLGLITGRFGGFDSPEAGPPLAGAGFPLAGVAILPDPKGGPPRVAMTNRGHQKSVFAFSLQTGFSELVRIRDGRRNFATPPVVQPNGVTVVGTLEGILTRTGANLSEAGATAGFGMMTAAPTLHKDGSLVVVSRDGTVTKHGSGVWRHTPGGYSIASAAASCTHVFVSTTSNFYTYDARNMQLVSTMRWSGVGAGGGLSSPVIGRGGRVYAVANDALWVFPGRTTPWGDDEVRTACDVLAPA
jgi:hypothetical protein